MDPIGNIICQIFSHCEAVHANLRLKRKRPRLDLWVPCVFFGLGQDSGMLLVWGGHKSAFWATVLSPGNFSLARLQVATWFPKVDNFMMFFWNAILFFHTNSAIFFVHQEGWFGSLWRNFPQRIPMVGVTSRVWNHCRALRVVSVYFPKKVGT